MSFSSTVARAWGGPGAGPFRSSARAFTLVELMVVLSILALLVTIFVPYFSQVFEVAYATMCRRNLKGIGDLLHTSENPDMTVPTPDNWVGTVIGRGGGEEILHCVSDTEALGVEVRCDNGMEALQDIYILQFHSGSTTDYDVSYLPSILGAGGPAIQDPQIWAKYPAGGVDDAPIADADRPWTSGSIPTLAENQAFIGVDNDSAILITFEEGRVLIECWTPIDQEYSRHFLMQGAGTPVHPLADGQDPSDEDDKELLRMWSRDYQQIDPRSPYGVPMGGRTSYGMNGLIEATNWGPGQFMLMDANQTRIDVGTSNYEDILEEVVQPRHLGKANVSTVDGSVRPMSLLELEQEMDRSNNHWSNR